MKHRVRMIEECGRSCAVVERRLFWFWWPVKSIRLANHRAVREQYYKWQDEFCGGG
jgi:hypothetical protein